MGIVSSIRSEKRFHPRSPSLLFGSLFGGHETATGLIVDADNALSISAVYAAVRFLSETMASLPLITYKKLEPRGKERDPSHPLSDLLLHEPNKWQDSMEWIEMMQGHLSLRGNAYSQIVRTRRGIESFVPLHPDRVTPHWGPPGAVWYEYRPPLGATEVLLEDEMFHLRGWSSNGLQGMSPVALARESLGLSLAAEEVGARFFGNSSVPKGVLEHPGKLDEPAVERLRKSWTGEHGGLENSSKVAILEEGMQWKQVGLSAEDAQFLQTRNFQIDEIARWFNVPPHIIRKLDKSSFSNIEQQSLEVVIYTLRPIAVRWEKAVRRSLYTDSDKGTHTTKFLLDALLRGDFKTRWEGHAIAKQNGILNADEIREFEDMNPQPDGIGQTYFVPLNMIPAEKAVEEEPPSGDVAPGPVDVARVVFNVNALDGEAWAEWARANKDVVNRAMLDVLGKTKTTDRAKEARVQRSITERRRLQQAHRPLFKDAAQRFVRREIKTIERLSKKFLPEKRVEFSEAVGEFYSSHQSVVEQMIGPAVRALATVISAAAADEVNTRPPDIEQLVAGYITKLAKREVNKYRGKVQIIARDAEKPDVEVQNTLDDWEENRAVRLARDEPVEVDGAMAKGTYLAAGMFLLRWNTIGDNCPLCDEFDGRVVSIESNFMNKGDILTAGTENTFNANQSYGHPPLHDGCDCMITAG